MIRDNGEKSPFWIILMTFVIAIILNLMPYPEWMKYAKPDWVLLVLFYWCLALPNRIGVGCGWFVGLILDVLYYSILGQHAVAKAFVAFVPAASHQRLRLYDLWQQCIVIFIVATVDIAITVWISHLVDHSEVSILNWQSALTTCLLWPLTYNVLRVLRHKRGIR
jgi:rod shape-determining protein MreD